jgi:hypothetical protein
MAKREGKEKREKEINSFLISYEIINSSLLIILIM